jgi:hypothetical protein
LERLRFARFFFPLTLATHVIHYLLLWPKTLFAFLPLRDEPSVIQLSWVLAVFSRLVLQNRFKVFSFYCKPPDLAGKFRQGAAETSTNSTLSGFRLSTLRARDNNTSGSSLTIVSLPHLPYPVPHPTSFSLSVVLSSGSSSPLLPKTSLVLNQVPRLEHLQYRQLKSVVVVATYRHLPDQHRHSTNGAYLTVLPSVKTSVGLRLLKEAVLEARDVAEL